MGCHYKCLIYTRMLVYLSTLAIHGANTVVLLTSFTEESMKIKGIRDLHETMFYFFTSWNFGFQMAYSALALFCDWMTLQNTNEKKPALPEFVTDFREKVFTVAIWPYSLAVTILFWAFFVFDRNLLYPEYFDTVISLLSNHVMHTFITVFILLEILMYPRQKPEINVWRILCMLFIEAVYLCTLFYVHYSWGIWIYPIFSKFDRRPVGLAIFLAIITFTVTVLYYVQFCVSTFVLKCRQKIGERFCGAYMKF